MAKIENIKTPRRAKAMRPQYFTDPNMDQMHAMIVAMATEISVLYDRLTPLNVFSKRKARWCAQISKPGRRTMPLTTNAGANATR